MRDNTARHRQRMFGLVFNGHLQKSLVDKTFLFGFLIFIAALVVSLVDAVFLPGRMDFRPDGFEHVAVKDLDGASEDS